MALPISFGTYSSESSRNGAWHTPGLREVCGRSDWPSDPYRHGPTEPAGAAMVWEPAFIVGDWEIDRQHRLLIGLINQLQKCIAAANQDQKLRAVFAATVEFVRNHFEFEESYLERLGAAEHAIHRERRRELLDRLNQHRHLPSAGSSTITPELVQSLKEWATAHILECEDRLAGLAVRKN